MSPEVSRRTILALLSLLSSAFLGFLIWLAMAVSDIRASVVRIEPALKSLSDSSAQLAQQRVQRNSERIDVLENRQ